MFSLSQHKPLLRSRTIKFTLEQIFIFSFSAAKRDLKDLSSLGVIHVPHFVILGLHNFVENLSRTYKSYVASYVHIWPEFAVYRILN